MPDTPQRPHWDDDKARALKGSIVLAGLTYLNPDGTVKEQIQFFGIVTEADPLRGIAIECHGETGKGETRWLPPDLPPFRPAAPGEYRLRSTGEVLADPVYVVSYTVSPPRN